MITCKIAKTGRILLLLLLLLGAIGCSGVNSRKFKMFGFSFDYPIDMKLIEDSKSSSSDGAVSFTKGQIGNPEYAELYIAWTQSDLQPQDVDLETGIIVASLSYWKNKNGVTDIFDTKVDLPTTGAVVDENIEGRIVAQVRWYMPFQNINVISTAGYWACNIDGKSLVFVVISSAQMNPLEDKSEVEKLINWPPPDDISYQNYKTVANSFKCP